MHDNGTLDTAFSSVKRGKEYVQNKSVQDERVQVELLGGVHINPSQLCWSPQLLTALTLARCLQINPDSRKILIHFPSTNVHLVPEIMAPTDFIQLLPVSPRPQTPPSSPEFPAHGKTLSSGHVQLLVDLLKAAQAIQTAPTVAGPNHLAMSTEQTSGGNGNSRARASKLEFKTVNEM